MKRLYYNMRPVLLAGMGVLYLHVAHLEQERGWYLPAGLMFLCAVVDFLIWRFDGEARTPKKS